MATVSLKNVMKIYPHSGDQKKKKGKKADAAPEKKVNLQVTEKGVVAVQQFNLDIADQEFIVLVGPSGCGKSTTLRMVAGLEEISEGQLLIDGKVMNDVAPKDRDIAMVFQSYALYPHMTVYENMAFSLKLKKVPKDEIDRKVKEAAETEGSNPSANAFNKRCGIIEKDRRKPVLSYMHTYYTVTFSFSRRSNSASVSPVTFIILIMSSPSSIKDLAISLVFSLTFWFAYSIFSFS